MPAVSEMPNVPTVVPCACLGVPEACECGVTERALRAWIQGKLPEMNPEQREWCLNEIASVEGWSRKDHENDSSANLASAVLSAWVDFCRDKGMM